MNVTVERLAQALEEWDAEAVALNWKKDEASMTWPETAQWLMDKLAKMENTNNG